MSTNSFEMLQHWMTDFMYDMDGICIDLDGVTGEDSGITVYATIYDVSTIKSDIYI